MRRGIAAALAILLAVPTLLSAAATPPRLVVILVVDQMRADYVDRFKDEWTAGLKRLVTEGAWFAQAAYPYLSTYTCAGHATIGTGAFPHVHGVFQNIWYDRGRRAMVTCTQDANTSSVIAGQPATGGESAAALLVPTFADEMRRQLRSRVVSLSLKGRSAIMLAGHGGTVSWISDTLDSWETSTAYASEPVPEVSAYVAAHPMNADYGQTWNRLLPNSAYKEPDANLRETSPPGWTVSFPHVLKGGPTSTEADIPFYEQWQRSPFADAYLARMAAGLTDSMGLGKRDRTDVLAVSFSSPDLVGHAFGPDSQEVHDMFARLDLAIGGLLESLDRSIGRDQYVVALTADHGVTPIPEQLVTRGRNAGRIDATTISGTIEQTAQIAAGPGKYVARVVGNDVYFEPGMFRKIVAAPAGLEAVTAAILVQPGIDRVLRSDTLDAAAASSADRIVRAAALSYLDWRGGDLILVPKDGWMYSAFGTTHGGASADDQRVPIILYGAGVKRGEYKDAATPADIAPTLAAIVGIRLPSAEGHVLRSAVPDAASEAPSTDARR